MTLNKEDCWRKWCEAEGFLLQRLKVANRFKLKKGSNILFINSVEQMEAFNEKYKYNPYPHLATWTLSMVINWTAVKDDGYQGIIISKYFWDLRLSLSVSWYYTWDCVSGCIWDTACLIPIGHEDVDIEIPEGHR